MTIKSIRNLHRELSAANLPVVSVSDSGKIWYSRELTPEEQIVAQNVIASHDQLIDDQELLDAISAASSKVDFRNLPNWATWTPQEASDFINSQIFSGQTQEQIDSWIDANVTTLATAKTALKAQAGEILKIRSDLAIMAKAILYLRNINIGKV